MAYLNGLLPSSIHCVCSALPLKATTATAILLFIVKVRAVVAALAISILRDNLEVFGSILGVITKEHSVLEIDNHYCQSMYYSTVMHSSLPSNRC